VQGRRPEGITYLAGAAVPVAPAARGQGELVVFGLRQRAVQLEPALLPGDLGVDGRGHIVVFDAEELLERTLYADRGKRAPGLQRVSLLADQARLVKHESGQVEVQAKAVLTVHFPWAADSLVESRQQARADGLDPRTVSPAGQLSLGLAGGSPAREHRAAALDELDIAPHPVELAHPVPDPDDPEPGRRVPAVLAVFSGKIPAVMVQIPADSVDSMRAASRCRPAPWPRAPGST
jgi:hypothetical protein